MSEIEQLAMEAAKYWNPTTKRITDGTRFPHLMSKLAFACQAARAEAAKPKPVRKRRKPTPPPEPTAPAEPASET